MVRCLQFVSPAQCTWLLATNAVQGEKIGNLNIPAVLKYRGKTSHEYDLISGAKAPISKNRPLILFEQHPSDFDENGNSRVIELLKSLDYDRFVTIAKRPEAASWLPRRLIFGYRLVLQIEKNIPVGFYYFIIGLHK